MRFVIVTGISGAGKSTALKFLEDAQYFCVDNLPILLLEKFASMTLSMNSEEIRNVALGVDVKRPAAWRFGRDFKKDEKAGLPI